MSEPARKAIEDKIAKYKTDEARLTSEPDTGEGVNELRERGKALELQRNQAMRKDPYFDYGQALLQIAIVLASVSIITGGASLLVFSGIMAVGGLASMLNGFFLLMSVPFIG